MTTKINVLAIDLAKGSFQVCAVGPDGVVVFNRAMSRTRLATLLADHSACIVTMEACATSHHWGRFAQSHGHEVRLVPAAYVNPAYVDVAIERWQVFTGEDAVLAET